MQALIFPLKKQKTLSGLNAKGVDPSDLNRFTVYDADARAQIMLQGISYTFVNCDIQECPEFVSGFLTLVADGQIFGGFKEI